MHAPYVSMKSGLGDRNNEFSVMMRLIHRGVLISLS